MKRSLDVVLAGLGLVLLAPVFAVTAVAIRINMGSPILFRQKRAGLHGKIFEVIKFRTMRNDEFNNDVRRDGERLTRLGAFLRKSSIDELPELINIIRGEMSLVGPRPLFDDYLDLYDAEQMRRHQIRPGLTGWAQVNGRNDLSWEQKFELDVWYVDNRSTVLDIKILLMTVRGVVQRHGISAVGTETAHRFTGNS